MSIFLDHNATTPLEPRVLDAMLPLLRGTHGNPASVHRFGREARVALDRARAQVAALVNAQPPQVMFTSGGTEADNLALRGAVHAAPRSRLLVSSIEHAAVQETADALAKDGWAVERIPVDSECRVDLPALEKLLDGGARLVSVMLANNETGAIQDVCAAAGLAHARGALLHTDAIQAAGKMPVDFTALGADLMTLSAHKLNGPRGVGALIRNRRVDLSPQITGGGQEQGLRGGTENLAGAVGFGVAAELARVELNARCRHLRALRDHLEAQLKQLSGVRIFAAHAERLPNTVQFAIDGYAGEWLVMELDRRGFAVSSGSACHSASGRPSHVLLAMGCNDTVARGAVRVSLGVENSVDDLDALLATLGAITARRRGAVAFA
ncbi:MAG: cysteine desulfurase [Gammaproteobacteria bacterium]|nr:cysteine desulfurase [Gammaproteobacteria bacterium]MDE1887415.1 cysteine desulfurase [Gammaproteobacteria bacterium]MDE2022808.1 cysteine desulfurase [Gammaproteobacteria bacterium]